MTLTPKYSSLLFMSWQLLSSLAPSIWTDSLMILLIGSLSVEVLSKLNSRFLSPPWTSFACLLMKPDSLGALYCRTCIFRAHLLFANGQPKFSRACIFREWAKNPLSNVYENAELNISRACIFREWSSNRENREK